MKMGPFSNFKNENFRFWFRFLISRDTYKYCILFWFLCYYEDVGNLALKQIEYTGLLDLPQKSPRWISIDPDWID